jgi:hypothetical protein
LDNPKTTCITNRSAKFSRILEDAFFWHCFLFLSPIYWSVTASFIPSAAKVTANDRCNQTISFGELTTYLRTPFAEIP